MSEAARRANASAERACLICPFLAVGLLDEIERGTLRVDVDQTVPLNEAVKGLGTLGSGGARGKMVVTVDI